LDSNRPDLEETLSIFPLGDSAITIDLGDRIDEELNRKALAMQEWLLSSHLPGVRDILVSYSSVTIFYDPVVVREEGSDCGDGAYAFMRQQLEQAMREAVTPSGGNGRTIRIPVCYGGHFGPDLEWLSREKGISPEEVVHLHSSRMYRVYMIGFLPGFSYLGGVDERLQVPRKARPAPVKTGSVGIAGSQTGIYPLDSPGGWQIIGRTPVRLFNPEVEMPILLKTGDHVQFFPVGSKEFAAHGGMAG
jgi:inhibitor of KinA